MNSITIAGNLTRDSETRFLPNGDAVLSFSVADSQGRDKPAIFWNASLFGKRGESLAPYLKKGQPVTVSGSLSKREWVDKEGNKRESLDLRVVDISLQGGKQENKSDSNSYAEARSGRTPPPSRTQNLSDIDSDIPF